MLRPALRTSDEASRFSDIPSYKGVPSPLNPKPFHLRTIHQLLLPRRTRLVQRQYPIGGLSSHETALLLVNPMCADVVTHAALMMDWQTKSASFQAAQRNSIATPADVRPLTVSQNVRNQIDALLEAYEFLLPPTYELAFVNLDRIVTPQKSVVLDYASQTFGGATTPLTDDDNARFCLGTPKREPRIDAGFLGQIQNPQIPNQVGYLYQFTSDNHDVRVFPPTLLDPFRVVDMSSLNSSHRRKVKSIPIAVGAGPPIVQMAKVPMIHPLTQQLIGHRLVLLNGVHRSFRLAQLGNHQVAALVWTVPPNELPNPVVETPREAILAPRPLMLADLVDSQISRSFRWKESRRLIRLQLGIQLDVSEVP